MVVCHLRAAARAGPGLRPSAAFRRVRGSGAARLERPGVRRRAPPAAARSRPRGSSAVGPSRAPSPGRGPRPPRASRRSRRAPRPGMHGRGRSTSASTTVRSLRRSSCEMPAAAENEGSTANTSEGALASLMTVIFNLATATRRCYPQPRYTHPTPGRSPGRGTQQLFLAVIASRPQTTSTYLSDLDGPEPRAATYFARLPKPKVAGSRPVVRFHRSHGTPHATAATLNEKAPRCYPRVADRLSRAADLALSIGEKTGQPTWSSRRRIQFEMAVPSHPA